MPPGVMSSATIPSVGASTISNMDILNIELGEAHVATPHLGERYHTDKTTKPYSLFCRHM